MSPTNHKLQLISTAAVLFVLTALPAAAQYQPMPQTPPKPSFADEVTVTATGIETEVDEAPTAVTVVTRDEMDDAQADRVVDMLRRVPGLSVVGSGDAGKLTTVFTRGTGSNQTLVMLDGVRLNSAFFGGFDWSQTEHRRPAPGGGGEGTLLRPVGRRRGRRRRSTCGRSVPRAALSAASSAKAAPTAGSDSRPTSGGAARPSTSMRPAMTASRMASSTTPIFRAASSCVTAGFSFGKLRSRLGVLAQNVETETGIPYAIPGDPTPDRRQQGESTLIAVPFTWHLGQRWTLEMIGSQIDTTFAFADPDDAWVTESITDTTSTQARLVSNHDFGSHTFTWGGEWRSDEVNDASNLGPNLDAEKVEVTSFFTPGRMEHGRQGAPSAGCPLGRRRAMGLRDLAPGGPGVEAVGHLRAADGLRHRVPAPIHRRALLPALRQPGPGGRDLLVRRHRPHLHESKNGTSRWELTAFSTDLDNLIEFDYATYQNHNIGSATIRGAEISWTRSLGKTGRIVHPGDLPRHRG